MAKIVKSNVEITHEGLGRVRIFDENVRKGILAVERIIYDNIEKGASFNIDEIIVRENGEDKLINTVVSKEQIIRLAEEAYDHVSKNYKFFTEVENQLKDGSAMYSLREWISKEIFRRISRQYAFINNVNTLNTNVARRLMEQRAELFRQHTRQQELNAAQKRHQDVLRARRIAEICWEQQITKDRERKIRLELKIDQEKIDDIRGRSFYLREIRALAMISREGEEFLEWVKSHLGKTDWFARRMGIREDVAEEMFNDFYQQYVLKGEENIT